MKILTLNTHSLVEDNYIQKLKYFISAIVKEQPEIIALQEVNQTIASPNVTTRITGYFPFNNNIKINEDNHVYNISKILLKSDIKYYWTWIPIKKGYNKFEEGIALMSKSPIIKAESFLVSNNDNFNNWKTRKILGICTKNLPDEWFFSVHYGWWSDNEEPFKNQWIKTCSHLKNHKFAWLMGDFNNPAEIRNEGYDMIKNSYWYDCYNIAEKKDDGITVKNVIDGWKDKIKETSGMRIDQIWCNQKVNINSSEIIFNNKKYPVVSDHYGLMIDYNKL